MNQDHPPLQAPPDRLNAVGVLVRREIEARIMGPLIEALGREFGHERVVEIVREVVARIAREQGQQLAQALGGQSLAHFVRGLEAWRRDDAMRIQALEQTDQSLSFQVTRCRYAEMYRALGMPELGALLSCNRDYALIEGFNPNIILTRSQTIMDGAPTCDFCYALKRPSGE